MRRPIPWWTAVLFLVVSSAGPARARKTWTLVYSKPNTDNSLFALEATDGEHAWALGVESNMGNSQPVALRTTDGVTWQPMNIPPAGGGTGMEITLYRLVAFSDPDHGWVYADQVSLTQINPLFYATTNGGAAWMQVSGPSFPLRDMQALEGGLLVGVGGSSVYLQGADGTSREVSVDVPDGMSLSSVFMLNPQCGFALATPTDDPPPDKGMLFWTADGGTTWETRNPLLPIYPTAVWFVDGRTGWIVGHRSGRGLTAWTTDGGASWTEVSVPDHPPVLGQEPIPATECTDLRFFDASRGLALCIACTGGCDDPDETPSYLTLFYWTRDGGRSWEWDTDYEAVMDAPPFGSMLKNSGLVVAAFPDPNVGFLTGQNHLVLRYTAEEQEEPGPTEFPCGSNSNTNGNGNAHPGSDGGTHCTGGDCGPGEDGAKLQGCGCRSSSGASSLLWLLLALGLASKRRRR